MTYTSQLPNKVQIGTGYVDVLSGARSEGILSGNSLISKQNLKTFIEHSRQSNHSGFLLWMSGYCISCIFQRQAKGKCNYNVLAYDADDKSETDLHTFVDGDSLIDMFCTTIQRKFNCSESVYQIQFLSCSCTLSEKERKHILRNHKSSAEKTSIAKRRRGEYHVLLYT